MKTYAIVAMVLLSLGGHSLANAEQNLSWFWPLDQQEEGVYHSDGRDLRVVRQATRVPGINADAVRLSRLDALRSTDVEDFVADGVFSIQFWVKVEWASRRAGHGDVINFITSDPEHSWTWRIGFVATSNQVMPSAPWPLVLRIGDGISTGELPVDITPWQWTHVGFVGDGEQVGVYRNGGLIGFVDFPDEGLPQGVPARGTLQVNGSHNDGLTVEEGRQGVWECDLRMDGLHMADEALVPDVDFPEYLGQVPSLLPQRVRLAELDDIADDDRHIIESLIRRVERIDGGHDTHEMRSQLLARIVSALAAAEGGQPPLAEQRGHLWLTYRSAVDQSTQPYEVYVPRSWRGEAPTALVVALHGSTEDETVYFERYSIEERAEEHGWIVVTPYGRGQRWYRDAGSRDVMDVIDQVKRQWPVDADRVYVTGHSMGGMGAIQLPMEFPGVFAAAAPVAGWGEPSAMEQLKDTPFLWVVGEADGDWATGTVSQMMTAAEVAGAPHESLVLAGYDHGGFLGLSWPTVVEVSLPDIFNFFARHTRQ
ncbi:MAG: prolyl oligopeptidase family serine peptidase [Gemmatimonadetes bacterium]|nr:prolyl oligopeptidase family serine peptidase [Gemmatimonadota bacterium]MBT6143813.1 prolyl oligopeptidase family serine peptidase [Gemmatimonadota bacterium]MBT7862441.1 prolyl oligopeptidase family serine peptidase [Gemmatimonadota bacterium]